ncbi:restriction endonuclease [Luteibacter jiangsuensis]|uniref:Restriction endonuclease n=1 Tax=Luteibacter jiangsuensis TaxID=637577 RepID=A0ABX0Q518_9GAMM|nr:restriction endonuclease [Luteibacter jiangsuensis]NID05620.1 restriction endonuclease [Luteibacter jiangsuensis]
MSTGFKPVDHRYDDALSRVSWDAFERLVAEHYRGLGYEVVHTGTGVGANRTDGGIDLKLLRDQETVVVQCKHWNCWKVPHNDVHQLIGVMHTAGATRAIVITSGEFTRAALEAAEKFPHIRLIDGKMVRAMLGPVEEPAMPHATMDAMPSWTRHARSPRRTRASRGPIFAATGALVTLAAAVAMLYGYYDREIHHAQLKAVRTALSRIDQTAHSARSAPLFPPRASNNPMSTLNGHPAIVHDAPMTKTDIAEWEKKNAESMRILEKTTPSLP